MGYKLVRVDKETFAGSEVEMVLYPDREDPAWYIVLKDGTRIISTHPVTVIEEVAK